MSEMTRRALLHRAYRETRYRVTGWREPFDLSIDCSSAALGDLFRELGVTVGAYLTAYNPKSRPTESLRNQAMQRRLLERIREAGMTAIQGLGADPSGAWPAEDSVLVPGADFAAACRLAREFDQEAMVFAGPDAIPRLVVVGF